MTCVETYNQTIASVHYSSATDLWETPQAFFDRYNVIYHFTLDVAATPQNSKCERFFTAAEGGLKQSQSDLWETEDKAAIQFSSPLARAGIARSK